MSESGPVFFFAANPGFVSAQSRQATLEPRWLRFDLEEVNTTMRFESEWEKRVSKSSGFGFSRQLHFFEPALGLDARGSVYHPYLLDFHAVTQTGLTWQQGSLEQSGQPDAPFSDLDPLQLYEINAALLKEKPYATHFYADKVTRYNTYDFYSRVKLDQTSYGANTGLTEGPVPFRISARHLEEDQTETPRPVSRDESTVSLQANNERRSGSRTDLSFSATDFNWLNVGAPQDDGIYYSTDLTDVETFGRDDRFRLNSSLRYYQMDSTTSDTATLTAQERFQVQHTDDLQSSYDYLFNSREAGPTDSTSHRVMASLRHKLYESLTSGGRVYADRENTTSGATASDVTRVGLGLNENYTKRLGQAHKVTLGYNLLVEHEDDQNSGPVSVILDEPHTLQDGQITLLNQPFVIPGTIQVTELNGFPYVENRDYLVIPQGSLTEIRRVVTGAIPNGATVYVDYDAVAQPSDEFVSLGNSINFRLDLFRNLIGLYVNLNILEHYGGDALVLQDVNDKIFGAEFLWRWLRLGGEYEIYDSNISPYRAARLSQSLTFEPMTGSTFTLEAGQSWNTWQEEDRQLTSYSFIGRLQTRLSSSLTLLAEGGLRDERGQGIDQQLLTARLGVEFAMRQLKAALGYELNNEDFFDDQWQRNVLYLRIKRVF